MQQGDNPPVARSVAGVVLRSHQVFLARRAPGGSIGGKWEFPGGKIEPGESASEALVREFEEELGVGVEVDRAIGESLFSDGSRRFRVTAYHVVFSGVPVTRGEHTAIEWFPLEMLHSLDLPDSDRGLIASVIEFARSLEGGEP
jgi:8-oxo-dGTP diphosphatase